MRNYNPSNFPKGRIKIALLIILALSVYGCATAPISVSPEEAVLKDLCQRYDVQWEWDSVSQVVTLTRQGLKAKAMAGSDLIVMGDEKIKLSAPLKMDRGTILVPPDFKHKVIDRLTQKFDYTLKKFRAVVIDPGHGGQDPGAIGRDGLKEKEVVLDIAKRLKQELEGKGIKVIMTRDGDTFLSLEERPRIAARSGADLFISIHANASRARSASGFEVYYLKGADEVSPYDVEMNKNYKMAFNHFSMQKNDSALEGIVSSMMAAYKQAESSRLAEYITRNTADAINSKNRGSKSARYVVLRNTVIPAVLVEVGFLSNRQEGDLLKSSSYRQKIADSLAEGFVGYASR
ncbi:MAG TPA: N-acetylmuramoyl-L-alanine amidase [Candidatus Omnitrophota bacterium]|nr:N-acetylmuramoyl-L-alanine amidase [Candidatus Omnitrophota bacterium]HPD84701.1 N-acetylmuramoyl-L-alanine amidase [Candidatus Omnitrophota bacterium]HRZ03559.1 N-acetylmuramoyl-L-alanine amidase [Candidatus Omnitrophota bacterium]